jgi:hypothetical protein
VYQYEPTIVEGCDPDRNAEYRTHIEAEIEALVKCDENTLLSKKKFVSILF